MQGSVPSEQIALNCPPSLPRRWKVGCGMAWLDDPLVKAAIPLAPATVLRTLADATVDAPPRLTVHLSSGHVLGGVLVAVGADRGSDVVIVADPESGRLEYALVSSVVAVALRDPEPFQDVLTGGRVPLPQAGGPVTRLALRREFARTEGFPLDVDWSALDESGLVLGNLAALLRGLRDAVVQVRADDMGQQAWAQVHRLHVEHRAETPLTVQPIVDGLSVRADLTAALPRALQDELVGLISASL